MSNLTELTAQIIAARAAKKDMSTEEFQQEMQMVYTFLKGIESGNTSVTVAEATLETPPEEPKAIKIDFKKIFKKDEVICLICNKGFKTLKKHLTQAHQITDKEYKVQFNIPAKQALVAKSYSDQKKAFALENKLGDKMQAGRKAKAGGEAPVSAVKVETAVPAVKRKAQTPVVIEKAQVPAKMAKIV